MVQERREGEQVFEAVLEAMTPLRDAAAEANKSGEMKTPEVEELRENRREAWMRQTIRGAAQKEGFQKIAVVCGAWHGRGPREDGFVGQGRCGAAQGVAESEGDGDLVPWTYGGLMFASGYGAGISSPGWYLHLWETYGRVEGSGFKG